MQVNLSAQFGSLLKLERPVERAQGLIAPMARDALFYPLTVSGKKGKTEIRFVAGAGRRQAGACVPGVLGELGRMRQGWAAPIGLCSGVILLCMGLFSRFCEWPWIREGMGIAMRRSCAGKLRRGRRRRLVNPVPRSDM